MSQLYYTVITIIRGKGSNIIKVLSLTLGLFITILLFAKIAHVLSYNTGYGDSDNLYMVQAQYTIGEEKNSLPRSMVMGPVPSTIAEAFPDDIVSSTVIRDFGANSYYIGENQYFGMTVAADSHYFQTMGIKVDRGSISDLLNPDVIFVSRIFAKQLFGDDEPIGKILLMDKTYAFTIRGIYEDLPGNNSVISEVVISMPTLIKYGWERLEWNSAANFLGFIRLDGKADSELINQKIKAVIEQHLPFDPIKNGWGVEYNIKKFREVYLDDPMTKKMIKIMFIVGIVIVMITVLNYLLIAISSLPGKVKSIGIHKCNGATRSDIFSMFMQETAAFVLLSLILVVILFWNFNKNIEEIFETPLRSLFALQIIWVPGVIVFLIFLIAGTLPGHMFSLLPVTHIFRKYTEKKQNWKKSLLFIQFAGVAFIFGLLSVVIIQYHQIINYDVGYNPENIAKTYYSFENLEAAKAAIKDLSMVEDIAFSRHPIGSDVGGEFITRGGKVAFTAKLARWDYNFVPLLGVNIKAGRNIANRDEVLVNEQYVRAMGWTDNPIGKPAAERNYGTVVGVVEDFVSYNLFEEIPPVLIIANPDQQGSISVRLKEPFQKNLFQLNEAMNELFPGNKIVFTSLSESIENEYYSIRHFRDTVFLGFIAILLITLMGLLGYVNDEIGRRSKEIAIRKINGAEIADIFALFSKNIILLALPAVIVGATCSYFVSIRWLEQFGGYKTGLDIWLYFLISSLVLSFIIISVILKSRHIARQNPVKSLRNE